MSTTIERPERVPPFQMPEVHVQPPMVYVEPAWEYRHIERKLAEQEPLSEAELNALGDEGWKLTGVVSDGLAVHFYFKRQAK
jgi:hypothetical protein